MTQVTKPNVLRIAKWRDTFERAESRKLKSLTWVSLPTSFVSSGYQAMLDEFEADAPAIYGAWCALVVIAAGCNVRGTLADSRGNPLKVSWYARMSGFPPAYFDRLIAWAAMPSIGWLDSVPADQIAAELLDDQQKTSISDPSGESPDVIPFARGDSPTTRPNPTQPNQTKPNLTQPNQTGPGGQIDWRDRWRVEDDKGFLDVVREIANKFVRLRNPIVVDDREFVWRVSWVSAAFDRSVAESCIDKLRERGEVKKPIAYIDAAMRKLCSDRGERWEILRELVPPAPRSEIIQTETKANAL